MRRKCDQNLR